MAEEGWGPQHILIRDDAGTLMGCCPLYLKGHSYGEYVFDHSWANYSHMLGKRYYPKLQSCVPFTPVTGPRLMVRPGPLAGAIRKAMGETLGGAEGGGERGEVEGGILQEGGRRAEGGGKQVGAARRGRGTSEGCVILGVGGLSGEGLAGNCTGPGALLWFRRYVGCQSTLLDVGLWLVLAAMLLVVIYSLGSLCFQIHAAPIIHGLYSLFTNVALLCYRKWELILCLFIVHVTGSNIIKHMQRNLYGRIASKLSIRHDHWGDLSTHSKLQSNLYVIFLACNQLCCQWGLFGFTTVSSLIVMDTSPFISAYQMLSISCCSGCRVSGGVFCAHHF